MKKSILLTLALSLFLPIMAQAHATPTVYEPESASVIEAAPDQVVIVFSERIEPDASGITITGPDGSDAHRGPAIVDASDSRRYSVPLRDAGEGTYLVSWQVVSADDGHFTKGAFSFSVGAVTGPVLSGAGTFQVVFSSTLNESIFIWLELLGQAMVLGALVFMFVSKQEMKRFLWAGLALSIIGVVAHGALKNSEFDFLATTAGRFSAYRLGLYLFAVLFSKFPKAVGVALVLAVLARARVSHAAASHFLPTFSIFVNFIHLFFKEAWIGAVMALSLAAMSSRKKITPALMGQFSRMLVWFLAIAGVSGVYVIWLHLKDPSNILTTDWGAKFAVMTLIGGVFLLLRLSNHFRPNIFRFYLEAIMGIALLFITSSIIITTPPLLTPGFEVSEKDQGARITFKDHPYEDNNFLLEINSDEKISGVTVTATEKSKGIGPLVLDTEKRFEGGYVFSERAISAGDWNIDISANRENTYDANASFLIQYPEALEKESGPGTFEFQSIGASLPLLLLAWFLIKNPGVGEIKKESSLVRAAIYAGIFFALLWFVDYGYLHRFRTICEGNGDMWHQMSPMRNGQLLSNNSVGGCMVKEGNYHFADIREYQYYIQPISVEVEMALPAGPVLAGRSTPIKFVTTDDKGRTPELTVTHERILHVVLIGEDLSTFAHIHPENIKKVGTKDGEYTVEYVFPKAGRYSVAVDLAVNNQLFPKQFYIDVSGGPGMSAPNLDLAREKTFSGYNVRLTADSLVSGKPTTIIYSVEKDGKPVKNMGPYLGAAMHISMIKEDLGKFIHGHGEVHVPGQPTPTPGITHVHAPVPSVFGPDIETHIVFPEPGRYKLFGEFSHGGKIILTEFIVSVL